MDIPCNPSAPPVIEPIWFAASRSSKVTAMPSINRAKPDVRMMTAPVIAPTTAATSIAMIKPEMGSFHPETARMPAVYAPTPK